MPIDIFDIALLIIVAPSRTMQERPAVEQAKQKHNLAFQPLSLSTAASFDYSIFNNDRETFC